MMTGHLRFAGGLCKALGGLLLAGVLAAAQAGDFSVSPILVDLKPGTLSETITVSNHATTRLRVSVRLFEWTQDENGADVYKDSTELVYFPRQMEVEPDGKRLVRVGAKGQAGLVERAYRLFIEEEPEPNAGTTGNAQVALFLRFGVPIFLSPAAPRIQPEVGEAVLQKGRVSLQVKNTGNRHFRINRIVLTDGGTYSQDIAGWYSLPGTQRSYTAVIPPEVCRRLRVLNIGLEGEGIRIDRSLNVDPASCA